ncbi:T9SS type A sorting domain-containing protein [Bacteroidota bacterium]
MIRNFLLTICFSLFLTGSILSQPAESTEIIFPTLGNCYLCQLRIEAKLYLTEGVLSAKWDYETKVTTVEYDETITDPFQIMQAVADTGHDTEWYPAPDEMYALLIGTCCEYERTIDYTNVEIGYLSLMGLWVYPVGLPEVSGNLTVSVYPTIGSGVIEVNMKGSLPTQSAILTIYSISGKILYRDELSALSGNRVDLTSLANGQYLAVISSDTEILSKTKLIITH